MHDDESSQDIAIIEPRKETQFFEGVGSKSCMEKDLWASKPRCEFQYLQTEWKAWGGISWWEQISNGTVVIEKKTYAKQFYFGV